MTGFEILSRGTRTDEQGVTTRSFRFAALAASDGAALAASLRDWVGRQELAPEVRAQAVLTLTELEGEAALNTLITALNSDPADVVTANVVAVLPTVAPRCTELLVEALAGWGLDRRLTLRNALSVLLTLEPDPDASDALFAALDGILHATRAVVSDGYLHGRALEVLARWSAPDWVERVEAALAEPGPRQLTQLACRAVARGAPALSTAAQTALLARLHRCPAESVQVFAMRLAEVYGIAPEQVATVLDAPATPAPAHGVEGLREFLTGAGLNVAELETAEVDGHPVPYLRVPRHEVLEAWERARPAAELLGVYPVVLGGKPRVFGDDPDALPSIERVLELAKAWRSPAWEAARQARLKRRIEQLEELDAPERMIALLQRQLDAGPPELEVEEGSWPAGPAPEARELELPDRPVLFLAFFPTHEGAQVAAWLRVGGFNDCPEPAEHVARLRGWAQRYGAEPVAFGEDSIALRVVRPPATRDEAIALARDQLSYCRDPDTTLCELAASLLEQTAWFFWWD